MDQMHPLVMMYLMPLLTSDNESKYTKIIYIFLMLLFVLILSFFNKLDCINIITDYINNFLYNFNKKNQVIYYLDAHSVTMRVGSSSTITKSSYSDDYISVLSYISDNSHKIKNLKILKEIMTKYIERYWDSTDDCTYMKIPFQEEDILIDEEKKIYCQISKKIDNEESDNSKKNNKQSNSYDIMIYKWIEDDILKTRLVVQDFLNKCKEEYYQKINPKESEKKFIFEYLKCEINDDNNKKDLFYKEYELFNNKSFDNIFFEGKDNLINYVKKFIYEEDVTENKYEKIYSKCGKTYKAGLLFHGDPGCGKTSTIKAILNYTNRHGIIINLSSIKSNNEIQEVFRNFKINSKKFVGKQLCFILEDCDAHNINVLGERSEKNNIENNPNECLFIKNDVNNPITPELIKELKKDPFDLSTLLNTLDGIIELHGVMIIMTTNHPDKLDEALKREGRFDYEHKFKLCSLNVIKEFIKLKFDINEEDFSKLTNFNKISENKFSPAKIQGICFSKECPQEVIDLLCSLS